MLHHAPKTLWRFVFAEQGRLVLLTAAVFVTVIAFAAAVKPLADGKLGPLDAIRFMFYAMPPMLQYALPFAAGFGACLAYHRMASENEVSAAHAGGISHRIFLMPAFLTGLTLSLVLAVLSMQVIPRFLRAMEELITQDATRLIVNSIERQQAFQLDRMILYADGVQARGPDVASGAYQVLLLWGVVLVQTDEGGRVVSDGAATDATVWMFHGGGQDDSAGATTIARIVMRGVRGTFADQGVDTEHGVLVRTIEIPNAFNDDPKFLPINELSDLRAHPERMNWIDRPRRMLAAQLTERSTMAAVRESLRDTGSITLASRAGEPLTLRAADLRWDPVRREWAVLAEKDRAIDAVIGRLDRRVTRQRASKAFIRSVLTPDQEQPVSLSLRLTGVQTIVQTADGAETPAGNRAELTFDELALLENPEPGLRDLSSDELLKEADHRLSMNPQDADMAGAASLLRGKIDDLSREILSKLHEQAAMSVACLVMVLTGAVMALRLHDSTPLTVYLWAFFPALGTLICISAGQQMTHQRGLIGLPLLWGGVGVLFLYTALQFRNLARN